MEEAAEMASAFAPQLCSPTSLPAGSLDQFQKPASNRFTSRPAALLSPSQPTSLSPA